MPACNVSIPLDSPVIPATLVYLCKFGPFHGCDDFMYLQGVRTGSITKTSPTGDPNDSAWGRLYHTMLWKHVSLLAGEVPGPISAIVSPPSRFPKHAEPYREALKNKFPHVTDLTKRFERRANALSGEGASLEDISAAMKYRSEGDEVNFSSLLVVDDVFSRGRTAAALILQLREVGLPGNSSVTVAFPLWLPRDAGSCLARPSDNTSATPESS
jgi:hypothetical protein